VTAELSEIEQTIIDIERARWKYAGAKDAAIMARLGWTRTRYEQVLLAMLTRPAVEAADPLLVRRLRRLREARRAARARSTALRDCSQSAAEVDTDVHNGAHEDYGVQPEASADAR
jgi:hypothetical protein